MFLKSLTISNGSTVIREIPFHKGLNLIVDESRTRDDRETGNNVGKTTVLMLIDFCLGGNGRDIYVDPENRKQEYLLVKQYLQQPDFLVTLVLKENLDDPTSKETTIERNFLNYRKRVQRIDGVPMADEEFEDALTSLLFPGHYPAKPTFRQIISHNIRYKEKSLTNTVKTLDGFTRDEEYETLYLFLLGCANDRGDRKQELLESLKQERTFKARLEREQTLSGYEVTLQLLNKDIDALNRQIGSMDLDPNFARDLAELNTTRSRVGRTAAEVQELRLRRSLIQEAQTALLQSRSQIDRGELQDLYRSAQAVLGEVHKTFGELEVFHNGMIDEKIRFIGSELPSIQSRLAELEAELAELHKAERRLAEKTAKGEAFAELENLSRVLSQKNLDKGRLEQLIRQIDESARAIEGTQRELAEIDELLFSEETERAVKRKVGRFNEFFSMVSSELYDEQYAMKVDRKVSRLNQPLYEFSVFQTNLSSGKKQGEISCFDIAYTLFADAERIPSFHFLLTDKKELMHDNQLIKIRNVVSKTGIQFVTSILRDKLPVELDKPEYTVVRLSGSSKLFRIEELGNSSTMNA